MVESPGVGCLVRGRVAGRVEGFVHTANGGGLVEATSRAQERVRASEVEAGLGFFGRRRSLQAGMM